MADHNSIAKSTEGNAKSAKFFFAFFANHSVLCDTKSAVYDQLNSFTEGMPRYFFFKQMSVKSSADVSYK